MFNVMFGHVFSVMFRQVLGITRLVERPTEKPDTILTRVRVLGTAIDISPTVNFQCRF